MTLNNVIDKESNTGSGRMVPAKVCGNCRCKVDGGWILSGSRVSRQYICSWK